MTRYIKYYFTPIVLLLLSFGTLSAQVTPPPYSAFKDRYELLEPFVSTGLLIDRSPFTISSSGSHFSPFAHDGTQQLNGTNLIFQNLHRILFHAAYDTNMMKFSPDDFDGIYDYALYNTNRSGFTTAQLVNTQPVNDVAPPY
jgi:hypothetical protein